MRRQYGREGNPTLLRQPQQRLTVWFALQHTFAGCVIGADINHSEDAAWTQQTTGFFEDFLPTLLWGFVKRVPARQKSLP